VLLIRLILLPFRMVFGTTKLTFKTGYRTGRLLGYRRLFVLGAGIGIGVLIAPMPGRELREKLRDLLQGQVRVPDDELGERVRFELSHSPRTWHLPQPNVDVISGRVVLAGEVPHETGRQDLERAASAVPGVAQVDNRLQIAGTGAPA
jgi:hypothetical protein